jgi:hypothetical protein
LGNKSRADAAVAARAEAVNAAHPNVTHDRKERRAIDVRQNAKTPALRHCLSEGCGDLVKKSLETGMLQSNREVMAMKRLVFAGMIMGLAGSLGLAQEPQATPQRQMGMGMMQSCPMSVSGAEVAVENTNDGISVTITTTSGDVAELRTRVESMAKMHTAASNEAMMRERMIPFTVKVEEIEKGARLTLTPNDPARLEEFRTKVRQHAERMKTGDCSMMQDMMKGMMGGMKGQGAAATPETQPEPKPNEADHSAHHPEGPGK